MCPCLLGDFFIAVTFASLAHKMIKSRPVISRAAFLGERERGSQEQTRRVCDAVKANHADAESMRKRSAGHAMILQRIPSRNII